MKTDQLTRFMVQSEEKSETLMETALYALFALSAVVSIWQFAQTKLVTAVERVGTATGSTLSSGLRRKNR